jgi:redox-sensitive bicupin YhaK (pirin superfamily)
MLTLRKAEERGHANHGWLDTYHSFSFADYYDPEHMGYGPLRVINDDRIHPGRGFGTHPHRDMEIVTYVLAGELAHKDSMGNGSVIRRGDVQRMSAGTGVLHSEFNASNETPVHLLQIWIEPARRGAAPSYEQKHYTDAEKRGRLLPIVSGDGSDGSVTIHQDARVYAGIVDTGETVRHALAADRKAYVHVATGAAIVNGQRLVAGDAVKLAGERQIDIGGDPEAEVLVFDLP